VTFPGKPKQLKQGQQGFIEGSGYTITLLVLLNGTVFRDVLLTGWEMLWEALMIYLVFRLSCLLATKMVCSSQLLSKITNFHFCLAPAYDKVVI
jgi:hypothetical protein